MSAKLRDACTCPAADRSCRDSPDSASCSDCPFSRWALWLLAALLVSGCALLRPRPAAAPAARPAASASRDATPKPFRQVVPDSVRGDDGLLTLYRSEGGLRLMAAIPDSVFGREMLLVSRIARTAEGVGYGGEEANEAAVRWERAGNYVLLRTVRFASVAADSLPI